MVRIGCGNYEHFWKNCIGYPVQPVVFLVYCSQVKAGVELGRHLPQEGRLSDLVDSGNLQSVRHLRYVPLAFLIGVEGFVFFLPFLMLCLVIHLIIRATVLGSKS
jgi:hypothetical protein